METNETQQRFIELRAQGWSYARIAQESSKLKCRTGNPEKFTSSQFYNIL
ncbi:MAG: hypothetical protein WCO56_02390 [Verrucomicrobiota bacterium]